MRVAPLLLIAMACGCGSAKTERGIGGDAAVRVAVAELDAPARPGWLDEVTIIGRAPRNASQLEIVGDAVWAGNGRDLFRFPLDGGAGRAVRLSIGGTAHVHVEDAGLVAIDLSSSEIARHPIAGDRRVRLGQSPSLTSMVGIFGLGSDLIWATKTSILAMPSAGGKIRTVVKGVDPRALAVAGKQVFFFDNARLVVVAARGGSPRTLADTPHRVRSLQVVGDRVFWLDAAQVASVPVAGGDVVVHASLTGEAGWLAVAPDRVAWMERDPTRQLSVIRSLGLPDQPARVVLELPAGHGAAAIHAGRLYFTTDAEPQPLLVSRPLD